VHAGTPDLAFDPAIERAFGASQALVIEADIAASQGKDAFGFDAAKEVYCDVVKAGIIDPTKVVRCALQNAASVGSLLLTTEAIVAEIPEEKKSRPMPPGGYGGGY